MTLFNHVGSTDVVVDVAGFFANPPYCNTDCLCGWGGYWEYGVSPGIRRWQYDVTAVAASYETAYTRRSDGTVWSWGRHGEAGNLGTGFPGVCTGSGLPLPSTCRVSTPQRLLITGVSDVAAGGLGHFAVVPGRPPA